MSAKDLKDATLGRAASAIKEASALKEGPDPHKAACALKDGDGH